MAKTISSMILIAYRGQFWMRLFRISFFGMEERRWDTVVKHLFCVFKERHGDTTF